MPTQFTLYPVLLEYIEFGVVVLLVLLILGWSKLAVRAESVTAMHDNLPSNLYLDPPIPLLFYPQACWRHHCPSLQTPTLSVHLPSLDYIVTLNDKALNNAGDTIKTTTILQYVSEHNDRGWVCSTRTGAFGPPYTDLIKFSVGSVGQSAISFLCLMVEESSECWVIDIDLGSKAIPQLLNTSLSGERRISH